MILTIAAGVWVSLALVFGFCGFIGIWWKEPLNLVNGQVAPVGILVPAWREGDVVVQLVRSLMGSDYPTQSRHVVVIADHCEPKVAAQCRASGAQVVELKLEHSSKVRALRMGLRALDTKWARVVVMDADNLAHPDMLTALDRAHGRGLQVVQGQRVPKRPHTPLAVLDGLMETMHNVVLRAGQRVLGAPAHLIGSGMSFDRAVLARLVDGSEPVGGFDKQYQADLCRWNIDVGYAPAAICFDEKVSQKGDFVRQRRRWMSSQLTYLPLFLKTAIHGLRRGRFMGCWLLLLALIPPRSILIAGLMTLGGVAAITGQWATAATCFIAVAFLFLMGFFAVGGAAALPDLIRSLPAIPLALAGMANAALRVGGANQTFLHTPHDNAVSIDEVLEGDLA